LQILQTPAISYGSLGIAAFLLLRTFFWLPFEKHEKLKKKHTLEIAALEEKLTPKFLISCNSKISGCIDKHQNSEFRFLRIEINTLSSAAIHNCYGKLISIEKDGSTVYDQNSYVLPFAQSSDADSTAKTIQPGAHEFLDVLSILTIGAITAGIATKGDRIVKNQMGAHIFDQSGEYIIKVLVCGNGVKPTEGKIRFKWKRLCCPHAGDWEKIG
jgi:hypothetical protein